MDQSNKKSNIDTPLLSIIIPHHGGFNILNECLESLKKSTFNNYEIIVVDNNSQDDSIIKVKNKFPDINILTLKKNLGYAGGCNKGAVESNGELLLFLNNDTTHNPNWIEPLVNLMKKDNKIGSIQPKILNINKKQLFDYAGGSGGFIDIFCFPYTRGRIFNHIEEDEGQYDNQQEIFWASGCAFITRKDLFLKILFDTKLFAYMEEIDYNWKSILLGYKNLVEPKSIVYHSGGTLENRTFLKSYFNHRNSMILFLTNHNTLVMLFLFIPKLFLEMISLLRYLVTGNLKAFLAQGASYLWILSHPAYIIRRIYNINKIKACPLFSILNKMYKPSIVIKYFILRKKKYSELIN
jgi:GT2 family glycosyltransferase